MVEKTPESHPGRSLEFLGCAAQKILYRAEKQNVDSHIGYRNRRPRPVPCFVNPLQSRPMKVHEARVRVRYAETDQMGVVYHSNYLIWMEVGRVEYCRAAGLRYKDLEDESQIHLAVVEASCRYMHPARYDEEIVIRTTVAEAHSRMVVFRYDLVHAESGAPVASGSTKHVFLGKDLRPKKLPREHWHIFGLDSALKT